MLTIRRFEERVLELSAAGEIAGSVHPCLGQEAIPVGAVAGLQPEDRIVSTYRGHGWALARGSSMTEVLGEILQRAGGTNGGRAGSALLSDPANGLLGENSIVGGGVPIAVGAALAADRLGTGRVVLASIGDGAMNQGATTEAMVMAAAYSLPVIFVVEHNGWAEMTPSDSLVREPRLSARGEALGIESHVVDGCDPFAVRDAVASAADRCREGAGPVLLECKTIRLKGHYNRDIEHYRPVDDRRAAEAAEPLARLRETSTIDVQTLAAIDAEVTAQVDEATAEARAMPSPHPSTATDHLYGPPVPVPAPAGGPAREMTYQRALNLALRTELAERPELVVFGEDVGFAGGIFGVTRGLQKEYGPSRVFDTPIAEAGILGAAVGASMEGMRPVAEIMWADFMYVALDQIVNQAANVRYVNRSKLTAPLTVRMQQGVTPGSCAQHSQSVEGVLAHVPGLKVGLPSTPQDAYAMLRAAIADPDPVIVIEHRALYQDVGAVDPSQALERAEGARMVRSGGDLVILTWGRMVHDALDAATQLEARGVEAAVLDLRWLRPLDTATVEAAVRASSGRALIVHEAHTFGGFGAELAAWMSGALAGELSRPVQRLGAAPSRIPSAPSLQQAIIPTATEIFQAALTGLGRGD
ncbi:thiamine pyrophosphate-dependent enzyme [Nocardioides sp.]|uniref:alpha-ketoacid dehydrogenase subunit alpha/beta n=1 Tax=Nocardioides sp. TaxID=35761 RepID=UPI0037848D29